MVDFLCSDTWASFDPEFWCFNNRELEVERLRRTWILGLIYDYVFVFRRAPPPKVLEPLVARDVICCPILILNEHKIFTRGAEVNLCLRVPLSFFFFFFQESSPPTVLEPVVARDVMARPVLTLKPIKIYTRKTEILKVPCSYSLTAMVKFSLLRYLSEFRPTVLLFKKKGNSRSKDLGAHGSSG